MVAVFPCYPSGDDGNPWVALTYLDVKRDSWDGEGWQAFEVIRDCSDLWRNPDDGKWLTADEASARVAARNAHR